MTVKLDKPCWFHLIAVQPMKYQMLNRSLYLEWFRYLKNTSVLLADSVNNYGLHASALRGDCIDCHLVALRVQLVVLIAQLKAELFDIGDRFRREQYLNHGRIILVYLVLKYLLVVQKRPATRKMNQYDFDELMEQQFFVFLVSDAENCSHQKYSSRLSGIR